MFEDCKDDAIDINSDEEIDLPPRPPPVTVDDDDEEIDLPPRQPVVKTETDEMSVDDDEEIDLPPVDGERPVVSAKTKAPRTRHRTPKVTCRPSNPEIATTMMADPEEMRHRYEAMDTVCGVIDAHYEHFTTIMKENLKKNDSDTVPRQTSFRSPDIQVTPPVDQNLLTRILSSRTDLMKGALTALLPAMPYNLPHSQKQQPIDEVLKEITLTTFDWIEENLIQAHGNWPICSRKLKEQFQSQPRTIHTWTDTLCAVLLCTNVKDPFPLRAFYPSRTDAERYAREGVFPQTESLCVLCQIYRCNAWYKTVREQHTNSLPMFSVQKFRVSVNENNGFAFESCIVPSDRGFHGLSAAFPKFLPACIKMGTPRPDPLGGVVPLQTLRLDYAKVQNTIEKVKNF